MILIHPPIGKLSEPPAGIARLAGALRKHGLPCKVVDANLEGVKALLGASPPLFDRWTSRAYRNLSASLRLLKTPAGYQNPDRYRRAVFDVNRLIETSTHGTPIRMSLGDYRDGALSPLRSGDLLRAAENPEGSPFFMYFRNRLERLLDEENPRAVGFSLNYLSQALSAFFMIGFCKREHPGLKIMLGGGLVTSWAGRTGWRNPFQGLVDELVAGPGERSLLSVFGKHPSSRAYMPDYDGRAGEAHLAPGLILPYSASSGCYWRRCTFCPENAEGNAYEPVAPEVAVREVKELSAKMNPVLVHFLDNAMSPGLLETIARQGLNRPWYGFVRITRHLESPDFCHALRQSGCVMLKLGLESGDQEVLDRLHKGINLETASLVLKNLKEAGIGTYVYLLFGTPAENRERAARTLDFTVRHGDSIDFLNVAVFNMPVEGPGAEKYETRAFYEGDLSIYTDFVHPSGWSRPLVRSFLDREFKRHPVIAAILRRDPPLFTSNHAPFFVRDFPWQGCDRNQ